jgi:putative alpha-1,2-mannosidase
MLIGSPLFERATFRLPGGDFTIIAKGNSKENVFVREATLNGQPIKRSWLKMEEFLKGGTLILKMGDEASDYGVTERPPSFSP